MLNVKMLADLPVTKPEIGDVLVHKTMKTKFLVIRDFAIKLEHPNKLLCIDGCNHMCTPMQVYHETDARILSDYIVYKQSELIVK